MCLKYGDWLIINPYLLDKPRPEHVFLCKQKHLNIAFSLAIAIIVIF